MNILNTLCYYIIFASVVLIYGVGTNKVIDLNYSKIKNITYCIKLAVSILVSSAISWMITRGILAPIKMVELFPLVSFLVFLCVNTFFEALIRLTTGKSATEFVFSYLVILLSVAESTSLINTVIISSSCMLSFMLVLPFIVAFKQWNNEKNNEKYFCRLFLFIAILILIITVCDETWLNPEVIQ